ncbi:MAG: hypothetical protein U0790_17405 [Isosphaeraceae bacterium]
MSADPTVNGELSSAWDAAAAVGMLFHEFTAAADGPDGQWRSGDRVRFGVGAGHPVGLPRFESVNLSTGLPIQPDIRERSLGTRGFRCLYHPFRALRPGGEAGSDRPGCRFGCDDPDAPLSILRRVVLSRLALPNSNWQACPNAAPFHPRGQLLWIPAARQGPGRALPHHPQRLTGEVIDDLIALAIHPLSRGHVLFYNGVGAGASVDHLHVHAVVHQPRLAIAGAGLVPRGQEVVIPDYPARGMSFDLNRTDECRRFSRRAMRLQSVAIPVNLVFCEHRAYLFARRTVPLASTWLHVDRIAAIELAGSLITTSPVVYSKLTEPELSSALRAVTLSPDEWPGRRATS